MTNTSQIPAELLAAYKAAHFRVDANPPFYPYVDQSCEALKVFYQTTNHQQFAFITAFNPKSELTSDAKNLSLQQALKERVLALNLSFVEGVGEDIEGLWPGEVSLYQNRVRPRTLSARMDSEGCVSSPLIGR